MATIPQQSPPIEFHLGLKRIDDRRNKRYGWRVTVSYEYVVESFRAPLPEYTALLSVLRELGWQGVDAYQAPLRSRKGERHDAPRADRYDVNCYMTAEILFEKRSEVASEAEVRVTVENAYERLQEAFAAEWAALVRREYRAEAAREAQHVLGCLAEEAQKRAAQRVDYDARVATLREELRLAVCEEARSVLAEFLGSDEPATWKPEVIAFASDPERLATRAQRQHGFFASPTYVTEAELFPEEEV